MRRFFVPAATAGALACSALLGIDEPVPRTAADDAAAEDAGSSGDATSDAIDLGDAGRDGSPPDASLFDASPPDAGPDGGPGQEAGAACGLIQCPPDHPMCVDGECRCIGQLGDCSRFLHGCCNGSCDPLVGSCP
jgi:hypothetical protein